MLPVALADARNHPRYKYFKTRAKRSTTRFWVCADRPGVLQGVLVVQTKEPRTFRDEEIRMLVEAAGQVAPVVSEARTSTASLPRRRKSSGSCPQRVVELGPRLHQPVSRFESTRWRQLNQNPISLLNEMPLEEIERRASELCCTAALITSTAASRSICTRPHLGRKPRRVLRPGRWPTFPRNSASTSRCPLLRRLGVRPGITSRAHPTWTYRSLASGCSTGRATSCSGWITTGWQREEYLQTDINQLPMQPAIGVNGEPVVVEIATRGGAIRAKSGG